MGSDEGSSLPRRAFVGATGVETSPEMMKLRIVELEAANAALSEAAEQARAEAQRLSREELDARVLRERLAVAERSAEEAWTEVESLRDQLERGRAELERLPILEAELRRLEERLAQMPESAPSLSEPLSSRAVMRRSEPSPSRIGRRLAKLRRDPKAFLRDSRFKLARSLARVL